MVSEYTEISLMPFYFCSYSSVSESEHIHFQPPSHPAEYEYMFLRFPDTNIIRLQSVRIVYVSAAFVYKFLTVERATVDFYIKYDLESPAFNYQL